MNRLKYLFLLIFVSLLTACGSEQAQTNISFMISGDPAERQAYLDLVAAY